MWFVKNNLGVKLNLFNLKYNILVCYVILCWRYSSEEVINFHLIPRVFQNVMEFENNIYKHMVLLACNVALMFISQCLREAH